MLTKEVSNQEGIGPERQAEIKLPQLPDQEREVQKPPVPESVQPPEMVRAKTAEEVSSSLPSDKPAQAKVQSAPLPVAGLGQISDSAVLKGADSAQVMANFVEARQREAEEFQRSDKYDRPEADKER
jgi:hypothetical protein